MSWRAVLYNVKGYIVATYVSCDSNACILHYVILLGDSNACIFRMNALIKHLGCYSLKRRLTGIGIPIINLRRSDGRLRFIMAIPIPLRQCFLLNRGPDFHEKWGKQYIRRILHTIFVLISKFVATKLFTHILQCYFNGSGVIQFEFDGFAKWIWLYTL